MAASPKPTYDGYNIYTVDSFRPEVDLVYLSELVYSPVFPITSAENVLFHNKSGKEVRKQSITVIADRLGLNDLYNLQITPRLVKMYIPSEQKGDQTHALFIPLNDPVSWIDSSKIKDMEVEFKKELNDHLLFFIEHSLLRKSDYSISILIRPHQNSFAFINFKPTTTTPHLVALIRTFLKNQLWKLIYEEKIMYIDAKIQKDRQKKQQIQHIQNQQPQHPHPPQPQKSYLDEWPAVQLSKIKG